MTPAHVPIRRAIETQRGVNAGEVAERVEEAIIDAVLGVVPRELVEGLASRERDTPLGRVSRQALAAHTR